MKTTPSPGCLALSFLFSLLLVGCGTTTSIRLTGTPGAHVSGRYRTTPSPQVSGSYRATHVSSDFNGTAAWQMEFNQRQRLEEFEFRKATLGSSVDLEIRQGRTRLVHATAEPGVLGLRVRSIDGWTVERIE